VLGAARNASTGLVGASSPGSRHVMGPIGFTIRVDPRPPGDRRIQVWAGTTPPPGDRSSLGRAARPCHRPREPRPATESTQESSPRTSIGRRAAVHRRALLHDLVANLEADAARELVRVRHHPHDSPGIGLWVVASEK
jgi:hypothetical protein